MTWDGTFLQKRCGQWWRKDVGLNEPVKTRAGVMVVDSHVDSELML